MALKFHPDPGVLVLCNYSTGFKTPEMTKIRPALIISPRLRNRSNLCTVVPLSTSAPRQEMPYHMEITPAPSCPAPYDSSTKWVKADMVATVGFNRLKPFHIRPPGGGERKYLYPKVTEDVLHQVRECVCRAIGLKID